MLKRHVIILAQGDQTRLPGLQTPKQLLPLPMCEDVPLMARTVALVRRIDLNAQITIVCRPAVFEGMFQWPGAAASREGELVHALQSDIDLDHFELADPGNSSLKGVARYLDHRRDLEVLSALDYTPTQTTILLGDCCYSWRCLHILLSDALAYNFVGTADLDESHGELWGITWRRDLEPTMLWWMRKALRKHPPFDRYQCGQLRRWLFTARQELLDKAEWKLPATMSSIQYTSVGDYTKDFDVPADLEQLDLTSARAALDDADHNILWHARPEN